MSKLSTAIKLLKGNIGEFCASLLQNLSFLFPDKLYLTLLFRCKMGYWIDWKNPKTFSEKLQWLKLYNRKPEYTTMVDKYAVKEYVAKLIGEEYIIPTLGVWDTPEEINWDELPNQFVLKTTHGGGGNGVFICRDKKKFDIENVKIKLRYFFLEKSYSGLREWPYKNIKRKILVEKYITDKDLKDYKFFCFDGIAQYCQVISGRNQIMCIDFFDRNWVHQDFHEPKYYPFSNEKLTKPLNYEKMLDIASILSQGIPFVRVDLYNLRGKIFFGEITFFPTSGFGGFTPEIWDYRFGSLVKLKKYFT